MVGQDVDGNPIYRYISSAGGCVTLSDEPCSCDDLVTSCGPGLGPQSMTLTIENYDAADVLQWTNTVAITGTYTPPGPGTFSGVSGDAETDGYTFTINCNEDNDGVKGWEILINSGGLYCLPWTDGGGSTSFPVFAAQFFSQVCSPFVCMWTSKDLPAPFNPGGGYTICTLTKP